ncbi:hypothetical protein [Siminovitchia sp. 179-K 8D1 HS]|uniref:hypothetical protein n=1 Tax=Siminovitchia sp. 179-K 8D1 HS TaxID=3142385 RepID=UPI0039A3851D
MHALLCRAGTDKGKAGPGGKIADVYVRQLTVISIDPYPEEPEEKRTYDDETPPSIKHITENTNDENFYRWGIQGGKTGNHRILYAIHNDCKVSCFSILIIKIMDD